MTLTNRGLIIAVGFLCLTVIAACLILAGNTVYLPSLGSLAIILIILA